MCHESRVRLHLHCRGGDMDYSIKRFLRDDSGATAIEYGLIAGLISIVIVAVLTSIGTRLNTKFQKISTGLN